MSEILPDPRQEFLSQDPRELKDPLQLTPAENQEIAEVSSGKLKAAAGLAAAFLIYRKVMSRRVKEEVRKAGPDIQAGPLLYIASGLWNAMVPRWMSMTTPYLLAGYVEGMRDARSGNVPTAYLETIARGYSQELGKHINDVSMETLVSGFQAQVNRKIPPFLAAKRAADAYGVPKRGMNALVNVWMTEDPKKYTDRVLPSAKDERVQAMVENHLKLRARQIGDNEEWAARTQAKQIVWMYGQSKGIVPQTARRVWITAADERVCKVCGPMDGRAAPVGEKFATSNGKYWTPPTHVNCRCDVILDLNMTEDMQDEITALLEAEQVSKARPGDPYDRDRSGRFARQESRQAKPKVTFKEPEPGIKLSPITFPVKSEQVEDEVQDFSTPDFSTQDFAVQDFSETKLGTGAKLSERLNSGAKLGGANLNIGLSPSLFNSPVPDEPIETDEGTWRPLERPRVYLERTWGGDHTVNYGKDNILIDPDDDVYEIFPDDSMPDKYERSLQKAIGEHWNEVMEEAMSEWYDLPHEQRSFFDYDNTGLAYEITDDDYYEALTNAVQDIPTEAANKVRLYGYGENHDNYIDVEMWQIVKRMNIDQIVYDYAPHLIVITHEMPGTTVNRHDDVWSNPGKFQLVGDATSNRYLTHYPYHIHYAMPVDLMDD